MFKYEHKYIFKNYFFREKSLMIEKQFFTKRKTVSYSHDTWCKAEKYFPSIEQVKLKGSDVKIHLGGEMFLVSSIWGEYQKRYTGIHSFDLGGFLISNTGINLDDDEWGMLTFNFENIKEAFTDRKDALKDIFTRPKQDLNIVKVYKAQWYLNGKMIITQECGHEFFSRGKAEQDAYCRKLVPGVDYPQKDAYTELHVDCEV